MLTPNQLKAAAAVLQSLFEQYEDFVIADIARRIAGAGQMTPTAELQLTAGSGTGVSLNAIISELQKTLDLSDKELATLFNKMGVTGLLQTNERLIAAGLNPVKVEKLPELQRIVRECIVQTRGVLHNFSNSMGFAKQTANGIKFMKPAAYYQDAVDLAMLKVRTGVADYNSAIKAAIKDLARSGVQIVDYKTGYHCGIDVAVRRSVLTGLNQMATLETLELNKELDTDLVEVTAHEGARPSHKEWQGKVYKLHGSSRKYRNLAEVTGYGTAGGLKGAYCRHSFYPYVEGMPRTWTDEQLRNIDPPDFEYEGQRYSHYEATQKQRAIERRVRQIKRELIGYESAGLEDAFSEASARLREVRDNYKDFSKAANIRPKNDRSQVYGFGRGIAREATAAGKEYISEFEKVTRMRYTKVKPTDRKPLFKYMQDYPESNPKYYYVDKELKIMGIKKGTAMAPQARQAFIMPSGKKDPYHVMERMLERGITDDDLRNYVSNATCMFSQWGGTRFVYFGDEGSAIIWKQDKGWVFKSAWKQTDYGDDFMKILEVLKKYGL